MATATKKRRTTAKKSTRKNPRKSTKSTTRKTARKKAPTSSAKRKSSLRKKSKSTKAWEKHRPVLYKNRKTKRWHRPERSRSFPTPTRLNPKGLKFLPSQELLLMGVSIAGGFTGGALTMPVLMRFAPDAIKGQRRFFGLAHIILGSSLIGFTKGKRMRDIGIGVLTSGAYDLIAENIPALGLVSLPSSNAMIDKLIGTTEDTDMAASYQTPQLNASYQEPMSASYDSSEQYLAASYDDSYADILD